MAKATNTAEQVVTASDRTARRAPQRPTIADTDIARRAYELYLARGCEDGHEVQDWLQAERELNGSSVAG
jgi:Protein of unknown function (DUF2934)